MPVADQIKFVEIAKFLDAITGKKDNTGKKELLSKFIRKWREIHAEIYNGAENNDTFYPIMRLLLPKFDNERLPYGIKEHTLAKLYIDILQLAKDGTDAMRLLNYRNPTTNAANVLSDFASVCYIVLKSRCPEESSLSIADVDHCLEQIAFGNASKDRDLIKKNLLHLLKNLGANEQKWLIRIIMKELKIGLNQQSIFSIFHPDATHLYNVTANLRRVCKDLHDPSVRLNEVAISLGNAFRPMLAARIDINQVESTLGSRTFYVETKMDGERFQLHKRGSNFTFYSRGCKEYSSVFGGNAQNGSLTPFIAAAFNSSIDDCILDGEMMGFDAVRDCFCTKGQSFDVKSLSTESRLQPCFCVFDVVYLNGRVLSGRPLSERLSILSTIFTPVPGHLQLIEPREISTNQEVIDALNEAIDNLEEGIIIKHPDSSYQPDKRKDSGWFKVKPDYLSDAMTDLDLLIIGGYFGTGRRSNRLSHFLLAVGSDESCTELYSFAKIGSGYTDDELNTISNRLKPHWIKSSPKNVIVSNEKPDVWIKPQNSIVVQVRAAEINYSERYKAGLSLRFPRLESLREDKRWSDILTIEELKKLYKEFEGKLVRKHAELGTSGPSPKKKRVIRKTVVRPHVNAAFQSISEKVDVIKQLFEGREFCLQNVPDDVNKQELERKILQLNGTVVQNPSKDTYCVIADKTTLKVRNIIKTNEYDVVKFSWISRCLQTETLESWHPDDIIHLSSSSEKLYKELYDQYGDCYSTPTSPDELRKVFNKMDATEISNSDYEELKKEFLSDVKFTSILHEHNIYISTDLLNTEFCSSRRQFLQNIIELLGGVVSEEMNNLVTHVIHLSKL